MEKELSYWIEVRPLTTGKFDVGNFKHVLSMLHKNKEPFRFFVVNCPSSVVGGRRAVKFFLELAEKDLADYIAKYVRTKIDVEVLEAKPPTETYEECVDFEMKKHYALPVCDLGEKHQENPVDKIVTALSEAGAFEVTAMADMKANSSIRNYALRVTGQKKSLGGNVADVALGILGAMIDVIVGSPPPKTSKGERERKLDPTVKAKADAAEKKFNRSLFTCSIKAYGKRETLNRITEALPNALNDFKWNKTSKNVSAPSQLTRPSRRTVQNALNNLCWITPLLLIALAVFAGLLNPLRFGVLDVLITVLALLSGIPFCLLFRKREPIVLSDEELSLVVGLPTAVRRLPIEPGTAVYTRRYLPTMEDET